MSYKISFKLYCKTCKNNFRYNIATIDNEPDIKNEPDLDEGSFIKKWEIDFNKYLEKKDIKCDCENGFQVMFVGIIVKEV